MGTVLSLAEAAKRLGVSVQRVQQMVAERELPVEELHATFLNRYDHDIPVTWFQQQLQPVFGIDVFADEFPKEFACNGDPSSTKVRRAGEDRSHGRGSFSGRGASAGGRTRLLPGGGGEAHGAPDDHRLTRARQASPLRVGMAGLAPYRENSRRPAIIRRTNSISSWLTVCPRPG